MTNTTTEASKPAAAQEAVACPYTAPFALKDPNADFSFAKSGGFRPASVVDAEGRELFTVSQRGEPELARFVVAAMNALAAPVAAAPVDSNGLILDLRAAVSIGRPLLHSDVDEIERAIASPTAAPGIDPKLSEQISTSEGGRRYVAEFFAAKLGRNDFGRYISTALAADFACALAAYLSMTDASPNGDHFVGVNKMVQYSPKSGSEAVQIPDTDGVREILGRMCFQCIRLAEVLRLRGDEIGRRAEDEQAAVLRFLLNHYLAAPEKWAEHAQAEIDAIRKQATSAEVGS